jgi:NADPH:quinone reductase-like Zn-dependent oxidoreductase
MTEVFVRAAARVSAESAYLGCVGEDAHQISWVWLAPESSRARTNDRVEVPNERLLPCPADVPVDRLLTLFGYWLAWRVTGWGRLEIGSGVLIVGSGGLAKQVADLCRCRGALWRGVWGTSEARDYGEFWFPLSGGQEPREILRALPGRPDSVLVLGGGAHEFAATLALCRDLGTVVVAGPPAAAFDLNLYPDVHRRGLTIHAGSPLEYGPGDVEAWSQAVRRINTLIDSGLLAPGSSDASYPTVLP